MHGQLCKGNQGRQADRQDLSPVVLTGYVPDLLKSITMMSDNIELGGCGACGKGYKEWVKVSDGGPYIKATIRLG